MEEVESTPSFGVLTTVEGGSDSANSSTGRADQERKNEIVNQEVAGTNKPRRAALGTNNIIQGKVLRTSGLNRVGQKYSK